jgi:hypothetical protein
LKQSNQILHGEARALAVSAHAPEPEIFRPLEKRI